MLKEEFKYFIDHQDELVRQYKGKYIVIKEDKVIGQYNSEWEAYVQTQRQHELGTFLIQKAVPGQSAYSVTLSPIPVAA